MTYYDVILIHPPSIFDFRKKPFLPGFIDRTVPSSTPLFILPPIGMVSIASYLQEKGLKVKIINLGEKMLKEGKNLDVEHFLRGLKAHIYGIGLHWVVHSQGAIEIARICKRLHPDSLVILGGLTATCFSEEIVSNFKFVDCIVRGEAEIPFYSLVANYKHAREKIEAFKKTPNLTFLNKDGRIIKTPEINVCESLDDLNFTNIELIEPTPSLVLYQETWHLPISRGCLMNCATCGGSKYSYLKLLKRDRPAFRSPKKLFEDFSILDEMGIKSIFLFQDVRLGGKHYLEELFRIFKKSKWSNICAVGLELFYPATKEYLEKIKTSKIADNIALSISPESAVEWIRKIHGRAYSNETLLKTIIASKQLNMPIGIFFMISLGFESINTIKEMWSFWEQILALNNQISGDARIYVDFGPMILLDPGSLAFDNPDKYGYRIKFKNFMEHYKNLNLPHWKYWINYETVHFNTSDIANIIIDSSDALLRIERKLGLVTEKNYELQKLRIEFERVVLKKIDKIMQNPDPDERNQCIKELVEISKDPLLTWTYIVTEGCSSDNMD